MKKLLFLIATCFILFCCDQVPEQKQEDFIVKYDIGTQLDSILTPYIQGLRQNTNNQAALAVGVTRGDEIVYARTFGYANIELSQKANMNTLFHIASVSKPFTAAAILKLVEQGKIQLDDRIIDHIPAFEMKGDQYQSITIRQILTHTSGIPRHISTGDWENPVFGNQALTKTLEDAKNFELDFEPGSSYNYSNSGFDLLGVLISRVSGVPFEQYVTQNILRPAGMTQSCYSKPQDSLPPNWAVPYSYGLETQQWTPYPYSENFFPSSGLQASLPDMCRWGMLHVHNGKYQGKAVLPEKVFTQLITPQFDTPWGDKIGLSWFLQSYLDRPIIMHTGNDTGFEAIVYVYPQDSVSITVMANRDFSRTARIMNATSEVLFAEYPKDYSVSAKYKFTDAYRDHGMDYASQKWMEWKQDTTDKYYVNDGDILTTGAVLENGGHWKASQEILQYYITLDSSSTYAWRLLGNTYLNLGELEKARQCYEKTLAINPNYEKGKEALEKLNK